MISYKQHQKHIIQAIWDYLDQHPHGIGKAILKKAEKFAGTQKERIGDPRKALDKYVRKNKKARAAWGRVYSFKYNAKYAKVLPYYDRYPLVLVLSRNARQRTFTGLNLHYIPPYYRELLMRHIRHLYIEGMDRYFTKDYFEDIGKLAKMVSQPCVHTYRMDKVLDIYYWNLPALTMWWANSVKDQTFIRAGLQRVWMDSRRKMFMDARWKKLQKARKDAARKASRAAEKRKERASAGSAVRRNSIRVKKGQNSPRTKSKTTRQSKARTGKRNR